MESKDSHCRRTVPMQVLSLGLPRTGTMSMQAALRILGYSDVHHGIRLIEQPSTSNAWEELVGAKDDRGAIAPPTRETFDTLLGDCEAVTDSPCAIFAEELLRAYPEAKVILVDRDITKWHASISVVTHEIFGLPASVVSQLDRFLGYAGVRVFRKLYLAYFHATDAAGVIRNANEVYRDHYARVRRLVPADRLLNYELGSGWGPLCEFLGKEEPADGVEFPWVNEAAALRKKVAVVMASRVGEAWRKVVWPLLGFLSAVFALYLVRAWSY